MVLLHFDSMDFPSWKSGRFSWYQSHTYPMMKPSEMDDRIGREQPFFRLYTDPAFTFMQGLSMN